MDLEATLRHHDYRLKATARSLGIAVSTLYEKIAEHSLEQQQSVNK